VIKQGAKIVKKIIKNFQFTVKISTFAVKKFRFMDSENAKEATEKVVRKIKEIRRQKGLSSDAIAIDLDMSTSAYNKMERLESAMSLERFIRIREILKVPYNELLESGKGNNYHQDLKDNSIGHYEVQTLNQENREIYEKLIAAKDEQIELLKNIMEKRL
jgi:transcriptional regulator with XRE-family HTH domain